MSDIVNEYFRRFYPPDWDSAWQIEPCVGSYSKRYIGTAPTIFPEMECADGFAFSVQGHFGAYSHPRDDFSEHGYSAVEVMTKPNAEPLLTGGETNDEFSLYGYVPVKLIATIIEKHGGLIP